MNRLEGMLKGYIPTFKNGKVPTEEVKNRTVFYSYDDVSALESYGGVLESDIVMVDIDDEVQADLLHTIIDDLNIDCNIIKTSRGKHFYFRNSNIIKECTNKMACVGITNMDIKLGTNNRISPLVINGVEREIVKVVDELDVIPAWLKPIRSKINFQDMVEGEGRNQALFTYILTLQKAGMTKEQVRETIRLINAYILKDSISTKEIETILRDDAFLKASFYNDTGKLQYEALATYLKDEYHIIKINNQLHIYDDGVYKRDTDQIERLLLKYINNSTKSTRGEVLRWLELICPERKVESERYILMNNGIYDIYDKKLLEHDPKRIFQNKINWNYNPNAYSETVENLLKKVSCNDESIKALIEEMVGFCLYRRSEIGKFFILTGEGSNGKSTILETITRLLGEDNVSSVSMKNLTRRFNAFQLQGKLANIGDDISGAYIEESEDLKKLTTGERLDVEEKGKNVYPIRSYAKLIFSANTIPNVKDSSWGFRRRMMIIPFNAKFKASDADFDPRIKDKLSTPEAMEYFLLVALRGLDRVITTHEFTKSEAVMKELDDYNRGNNPVIQFCDEVDVLNKSVNSIYRKYAVWCHENGYNPLTSNKFTRQVKSICECDSRQVRLPDKTREYIFCTKEGIEK